MIRKNDASGGFAGPASGTVPLRLGRREYGRSVLLLIWGRVIFLLLLGASFAAFNYGAIFPVASPDVRALLCSIAASLVLSILYLVYYYEIGRSFYWLAFVQIMLDIPLCAVLVMLTGGADSYFVFLFHVSILVAAVYCGGRGIVFSLCFGITLYVLQALMEPAELVPIGMRPFAVIVEHDPVGLFYRIGLDAGSMIMVAVLTGFLVARASRAGEKLKKAEAIFNDLNKLNEAIVSLVPSGIITVDADARIRTANEQARDMLGFEGEQWEGADVTRFLDVPLDELPDAGSVKEIALGEGEEERICEVRVGPLRGEEGRPVGRVIHLLDVTARQALQKELARMERNSALGNLAIGLAHEIRNPLGSISGSIEMIMQDSSFGEEDRKLLRIVLKEAGRIDNLVSMLLNLTRMEEKLEMTVFPLAELADEVISIFNASEDSYNAVMESRIPRSLLVEADRDRIGQVVLNLLKNGAESMAGLEGGRMILEAEEVGGGNVEVRAVDEGAGVDASDMEKIFEEYFTTKNWGIGVGLSVSRRIVERHGQTLGYRPGKEKGSVFFFTLKKVPAAV